MGDPIRKTMKLDIKKMPKGKKGLIYDPRFYFPVFLVSNVLLAYSHLPFLAKIWIGTVCLSLPLFLGFLTSRPVVAGDFPLKGADGVLKPTWGSWIFVLGLGAFLRLYQYVTLPAWPMWDDSLNSLVSIRQMEHWTWQLAFTMEKVPPLLYWIQALFFKVFSPSLSSVWLLPALGSVLMVPLGYWACRQYFSKSPSFLVTIILALSFWPLFLKFFYLGQSVVIWEIVSLGVFGLYLKSLGRDYWNGRAFLLGSCLGVGLYTYVTAAPAILILGSAFLWTCLREKGRRPRTFFAFFFAFSLLAMPILFGITENLSSGHAHQYSIFDHHAPLAQQLAISLSHATAILWGTIDRSYFNFGPLWGGYLNPVLASFFLLGLIELFRFRKRPLGYGAFGALLVCLLPGVLSNTVEVMRVVTLFPFVMLLTALGVIKFTVAFPRSGRLYFLAPLLFVSFSLDVYHLWGPFHRWAVPDKYSAGSKSPEHFQAFQIMDRWRQEKGPGFVLSDLYFDVFDESLFVTTYPFNTAANPNLSYSQSKWAAVILGNWDRGEFAKNFSGAVFFDLAKGLPGGGIRALDGHGPGDFQKYADFLFLGRYPQADPRPIPRLSLSCFQPFL